ncbi:MAG: regulator of nucleoside diphosphate kinase, partial [Spirochaetes bacterium]
MDEYIRLKALVKALRLTKHHAKASMLDIRLAYLDQPGLEGELERETARVIPNSSVSLQCQETGEKYCYKVVFPGEADIAKGNISLLTPLGTALIGRMPGERFTYESPGGV